MAIFKCIGYFYFHMPEGIWFANRQTHMQETTTKLTKKISKGNPQMETCRVWPREKKRAKKPAKQIFFRHMKIKTSYALEDGHVGRNTYCKKVTTNTIKLHAGGNITCKTHWTIQCSRMLKYSIMEQLYYRSKKACLGWRSSRVLLSIKCRPFCVKDTEMLWAHKNKISVYT
jgi:hypothetical protein